MGLASSMPRRAVQAGPPLSAVYLLHMWVPVATVMSMALCLTEREGGSETLPGLDPAGTAVLALGVFVVYTGDRLLEHGHGWGGARPVLWAAVGLAAFAVGGLALLHPALWIATAVLGALSLGYLKLKSLAVAKTVVVGLTWAVGCAVLARNPQPGWHALGEGATGSLMLAVCAGAILCDLKDACADRARRVDSLPVLLGTSGAVSAAALCALSGAAIAASVNSHALIGCNLGMLLLCPWPRLLSRAVVGPLIVDTVLMLPGLWLLQR